jgi:hypothetical protein
MARGMRLAAITGAALVLVAPAWAQPNVTLGTLTCIVAAASCRDRRRPSLSRGCWTRRHPRTIYCLKCQPFVEPTKNAVDPG